MASSQTSPRLALGKRIDQGSLEIVKVLGVGGYGIVYQAVETSGYNPRAYAVKCLRSMEQPPVRRQFHIREIALHQISSAHPGIVTLHRVIEDHENTYIIMDYAPNQDLFTQILNNCRYLGNDALIKHVFLQLVDAIEYCHSLGIYHRDLKPENVLCFEEGHRVAITDFGLATTEKMSGELNTGSIYHMSPECQGGAFALDGSYSPRSNDIWSLGIILLNLATGRNPWRTATTDDLTFQAYLRDPLGFFPSVLPVSLEINDILIQMLHVDWTQRATLPEIRQQMEDITSFYAPDVVFDGSQARCAWEARADSVDKVTSLRAATKLPAPVPEPKSRWSDDSASNVDLMPPASREPHTHNLNSSTFVRGDLTLQVDRRGSWESSTSSHLSYTTSPTTPNSDSGFADVGLVQTTMHDLFEKTRQEDEHVLQSMETSMVFAETMSSSAFDRNLLATMDVPIPEVEDLWAVIGTGDTTCSWGTPGSRAPSSSSTNSASSSEIAFAKSISPSADSYICSFSPSSSVERTSYHRHDDKLTQNSMRLLSRPSFYSSIPESLRHRTFGDPRTLPGHHCPATGTALGSTGTPCPKVREEEEGHSRVTWFGSAKNWFSSGRLHI
ncbi:hypothetical protein DXG03_002419 [Asterophora parasitica]|uniref:Protein kinase domain-containing protein n=1 Tax=Asterophora parasitica TaxID=117018 RepID=A0A9P7GGR8_9AGAR|nr:hypothetical protein DXG03_002419 [Asterophora parasitica]